MSLEVEREVVKVRILPVDTGQEHGEHQLGRGQLLQVVQKQEPEQQLGVWTGEVGGEAGAPVRRVEQLPPQEQVADLQPGLNILLEQNSN